MKNRLPVLLTALMLALGWNSQAIVRYVDLTCTNPTPPFLDWSTAATNIQDAIDASVDGDQILVTNGVYRTGGKVMAGDLTNRVVLDKAVTVQSMNGPWVTSVQGSGTSYGPAAVRCAWLTNGAALVGFTLRGGATRSSGDSASLMGGGGVWCASSSATVINCLIISNFAAYSGGGVYQGTIRNCWLAYNGGQGGTAHGASLNNCTVVSNTLGGASSGRLTNCIVYYNSLGVGTAQFSHCCTSSAQTGDGNFTAAPLLLADGMHLTVSSPCIGTGTNLVGGTDLFGYPWSDPPSVGCAEWQPAPVVTAAQLQPTAAPKGFTGGIGGIAGQPPFACWWLKNGVPLQDDGHFSATQTTNLIATGISVSDAGNYQLVVSNAVGVVTSSVAPLVVHCVDAGNARPVPPYTNWATAASTIQDAIGVAAPNEVVLVTNGLYATGGKSMEGILTNRVCVDKPLLVTSVNGPMVTTIQGMWDGVSTNGNGAVRCAWLTNGASLAGFTVQGGATRTTGDLRSLGSGGGVWCASASALLANCRVVGNAAYYAGGGVYQGSLRNSMLLANAAIAMGSGAYGANLNNCTVVSNSWSFYASAYAVATCQLTNCIVYYNASGYNYSSCVLSYCCATPAPAGTGNSAAMPQLFPDGVHLTGASPCLGAGTNTALGTDIFGLPWANPPSVGCAEWDPEPLVATPQIAVTGVPAGVALSATVTGQPPFTFWWLKDGMPLSEGDDFGSTQTPNLTVSGTSLADAGSYQLVVSNAFGVVTSAVARLVVHCVDSGSANPVAPYATWATAASNIQDAIGAALANEVVLVTNGLYATGGKSMDGIITNRVSLDKGLLVQSMNGPSVTTIQGALDPGWTNGPAAVRCAWLTNKAVLSGFTLFGGATRSSGTSQAIYGGGAWGSSVNAILDHCQVFSNYTASVGGGAYQVTLNNCTLMGNHSFNSGFGAGGAANCNLGNCVVTANVADQGAGGGLWSCNATNCSLTKNSAYANGGAASGGVLINCTITGNSAANGPTGYSGGGVDSARLTNCIVWGNVRKGVAANFYNSTLAYCCTDPLASGPGNIDVDPQLLPDGVHVAQSSPCRGVGISSVVVGTDFDGQPWNTPPAMGCDEWQPVPVLAGVAGFQVTAPGCLVFSAPAAGQAPFNWLWSKDGAPIGDDAHYTQSATPNLGITHLGPADAGVYQAVVSNSFGAVTSQVIRVVIRVVDAAGASPAPPYTNWASAAATIQDAIDVGGAGDIVLVTNGVYAIGGKAMAGNLTNRIVLDKALTVMSVNGFSVTSIQGVWDPVSTNGNWAVRCAWLTNGATLVGFTLRNGATRPADGYSLSPTASGGGVWCSSTNAFVSNCILSNNSAGYGGAFCYGTLNNSLVLANHATDYGGAAYWAVLNNCMVINNSGAFYGVGGAGTYSCTVRNSIVLGNFNDPNGAHMDNYEPRYAAVYVYSYTDPLPYGTGNLTTSSTGLQSLDSFHIASTSACRGTGSALYATGTDLDGEPWANPPSIGCDEVVLSNLVGALSVNLLAWQTNVLVSSPGVLATHYDTLWGAIAGRAARVEWNYGDGPTVTNAGATTLKTWATPGDYTVTFTAFNTDNPSGVSTSLVVHVSNLVPPQLQGPTVVSNQFGFQFAGEQSANYTVQYTTNLAPPVVWQTMQSFYYSSGQVYQITDPAVTNGTRFYRVLAQ